MIRHTTAAALAVLSLSSHATVLTFEDSTLTGASRILGSATADAHGPSLLDYAGYAWTGMVVTKPSVSVNRPRVITGIEPDGDGGWEYETTAVDAGFHRAAVSGSTVAYTQSFNGASSLFASIKALDGSPHFDFNSVWLTSGWRGGIDVLITGWRDGLSVYSQNLVIDDDEATKVSLGFLDIDEIRFTTSGGDFLYANGNQVGSYLNPSRAFSTPVLVFDDMDISATVANTVPEPTSFALAAMALLALGWKARGDRR